MVTKKLDEKKLKCDLIDLYQRFIEEPYNSSIKRKMWDLSGKYASASDLIRSSAVAKALNDLAFFAQEELPDGKDHLVEAKSMLRRLKENK